MKTKFIASIIAVAVFIGIILLLISRSNTSTVSSANNQTSPVPSVNDNPAAIPTADSSKTNKYKNGVYTATGKYDSPAGLESIGVSITIDNGVITSSSVTANATNNRSYRYQQAFIDGYKKLVVGKNIDTISLDRVSGSSLTPAGFNNALDQIKQQAQA